MILSALLAVASLGTPVNYDFDVRLLPEDRQMIVEGQMTFDKDDDSESIDLLLSKRMLEVRFAIREPSGVFVKTDSQPRGDDILWTLHMSPRVRAATSVTVTFQYRGSGETASQYHIGPDVAFASAYGTDWYPLVTGRDDRGTALIRLHVPPAHNALATGNRVGARRDPRERVVEYEVTHPTYLAFASGPFHIHRHDGAPPLSAFLLQDRPGADRWLRGVASIVTALQREFGPYPFSELVFVEVPRDLANTAGFNAAGLQGLILLNHRAFDVPDVSYLWEWLGHEVGHVWFPNYLSLTRPGGRYMEEALVEYGALSVVEILGGEEVAKQFRLSGYPPIRFTARRCTSISSTEVSTIRSGRCSRYRVTATLPTPRDSWSSTCWPGKWDERPFVAPCGTSPTRTRHSRWSGGDSSRSWSAEAASISRSFTTSGCIVQVRRRGLSDGATSREVSRSRFSRRHLFTSSRCQCASRWRAGRSSTPW